MWCLLLWIIHLSLVYFYFKQFSYTFHIVKLKKVMVLYIYIYIYIYIYMNNIHCYVSQPKFLVSHPWNSFQVYSSTLYFRIPCPDSLKVVSIFAGIHTTWGSMLIKGKHVTDKIGGREVDALELCTTFVVSYSLLLRSTNFGKWKST